MGRLEVQEVKHDELLAKIDASGFVQGKDYVWSLDGPAVKKANAALRAVVELHKPSRIDKDMTYCEGCSNSAFFPWKSCPTIEAIEKELG